MAETNAELGRAVSDVLAWLGATPDTAGALLGINNRTLTAMAQGIVPMRSIVIKFATGVARHCDRDSAPAAAPEWWKDVDAWLNVAGYSPRRDVIPNHVPRGGVPSSLAQMAPPPRLHSPPASTGAQPPPQRAHFNAPPPRSEQGAGDPGPPAREHYRPVYERVEVGDSFVHVFWIQDPEDRRVFKMTYNASIDYKARAQQVKQDLANLSRDHFERKYGRFRIGEQ